MLCCVCCVHKSEWFGVNAGYYLAGDGSWAGQMAPATIDKDGSTGLVPAPLLGQNDSYLRGDGKWIRANNAPTAAQYIFAKNNNTVEQKSNGSTTVPTYLTFPTADTLTVGSAASQTNTTTFTLQVGYTYKISSAIPYALAGGPAGTSIQIYVGGVAQGVTGGMVPISNEAAYVGDLMAICYVAPTVISTVQIGFFSGTVTTIYSSWMTIEVVSNNNTITAFSGATSTNDGIVGYIPKPLAGQQNHVLSGSGGWRPVTQTYINARISSVSGSNLAFTTFSASPVCPNPFVLTNPTTFTSPNISGNYKIDIVLNSVNSANPAAQCILTPVVGGVSSTSTITSRPTPDITLAHSGVVILNIPANTTLTFSLTNITGVQYGGTITIVSI